MIAQERSMIRPASKLFVLPAEASRCLVFILQGFISDNSFKVKQLGQFLSIGWDYSSNHFASNHISVELLQPYNTSRNYN